MSDLISREEARNLMYHKQEPLTEYDLDSLPTIKAEPVRHGYWEIHTDAVGNTYYECSYCHTTWWEIKSNDNYCSACGARMDGE